MEQRPPSESSMGILIDREQIQRLREDMQAALDHSGVQCIMVYLIGGDERIADWFDHLPTEFMSPRELQEAGPAPMPDACYIGGIGTVYFESPPEEVFLDVVSPPETSPPEAGNGQDPKRRSGMDREPGDEEGGSQGTLPI